MLYLVIYMIEEFDVYVILRREERDRGDTRGKKRRRRDSIDRSSLKDVLNTRYIVDLLDIIA